MKLTEYASQAETRKRSRKVVTRHAVKVPNLETFHAFAAAKEMFTAETVGFAVLGENAKGRPIVAPVTVLSTAPTFGTVNKSGKNGTVETGRPVSSDGKNVGNYRETLPIVWADGDTDLIPLSLSNQTFRSDAEIVSGDETFYCHVSLLPRQGDGIARLKVTIDQRSAVTDDDVTDDDDDDDATWNDYPTA